MTIEVLFDRRQRDEPVAVERRKRGRPKKEGTVRVQIRLPISAYDTYCRMAVRMKRETAVGTILRHIVMKHLRRRHERRRDPAEGSR